MRDRISLPSRSCTVLLSELVRICCPNWCGGHHLAVRRQLLRVTHHRTRVDTTRRRRCRPVTGEVTRVDRPHNTGRRWLARGRECRRRASRTCGATARRTRLPNGTPCRCSRRSDRRIGRTGAPDRPRRSAQNFGGGPFRPGAGICASRCVGGCLAPCFSAPSAPHLARSSCHYGASLSLHSRRHP